MVDWLWSMIISRKESMPFWPHVVQSAASFFLSRWYSADIQPIGSRNHRASATLREFLLPPPGVKTAQVSLSQQENEWRNSKTSFEDHLKALVTSPFPRLTTFDDTNLVAVLHCTQSMGDNHNGHAPWHRRWSLWWTWSPIRQEIDVTKQLSWFSVLKKQTTKNKQEKQQLISSCKTHNCLLGSFHRWHVEPAVEQNRGYVFQQTRKLEHRKKNMFWVCLWKLAIEVEKSSKKIVHDHSGQYCFRLKETIETQVNVFLILKILEALKLIVSSIC